MLALLRVRFKCYVDVCYRHFVRHNISVQEQKCRCRPSHASLVKKLSIVVERRLLQPRDFICFSDIFSPSIHSLFFLRRLISEIFACNWNQEKFRKFCDGKHFGSHICWHLIIGCSLISGCPSIIPGASAGVIYSPNFPWSYPLSRSCEWRIRAPWGQRVHLKFIKFNLETSSFSCEFDYMEVLDKYNTQLGKYCGSDIPSSISSSSSLTVKFNSDYSNTFSGFLLLYQTGYSFPTGAPVWTTYRPYTSTTVQYHSCSSYSSETSKFISFL